jgi:hypothetical protein
MQYFAGPMPLELKDVTTQKSLIVPDQGLTFGREGGDANVQIRDTGVSKRHARVFAENGAWFLEDLGSSNGTWLQKERIKDATELLPGDVFQMSQAKFEVLQTTDDADGSEPTSMENDEGMEDGPRPHGRAPTTSMPRKAPSANKEVSTSKSGPAPGKKPPGVTEGEISIGRLSR